MQAIELQRVNAGRHCLAPVIARIFLDREPTIVTRPLQRICRIATWLVWATFACRALTPLGYMPAAAAEGGPFILCPSGSQAELVQYLESRRTNAGHAGHHHHGGGADHERHGDGSECPIGASFAAAVPTTLAAIDTLAPRAEAPLLPVVAPIVSAAQTRYHSRAPPSRRSA